MMKKLFPKADAWMGVLLGVAGMLLVVSWSVYVHLNNAAVVRRAQQIREATSVHEMTPETMAEIHEGLRLQKVLEVLYPEAVAERLGAWPRLQVETGTTWLCLAPFFAFLLTRRARKDSLSNVKLLVLTLRHLAACAFLSHAIIASVQVLGLQIPFVDALTVSARFAAVFFLVGAAYVGWFTACHARFGHSGWVWTATSLAGLMGSGGLRLLVQDFDRSSSFLFLGGVDRYLLDSTPRSVALGLLATAAWFALSAAIWGRPPRSRPPSAMSATDAPLTSLAGDGT